MDPLLNITEVRQLGPIAYSDLKKNNYDLTLNSTEHIEKAIAEYKTGERLTLGQLILIKSFRETVSYGGIHAIVTGMRKVGIDKFIYTMIGLGGNIDGELFKLEYGTELLLEGIKHDLDDVEILLAIKDSKLGNETIALMLTNLGIESIAVYDSTNENFKTWF